MGTYYFIPSTVCTRCRLINNELSVLNTVEFCCFICFVESFFFLIKPVSTTFPSHTEQTEKHYHLMRAVGFKRSAWVWMGVNGVGRSRGVKNCGKCGEPDINDEMVSTPPPPPQPPPCTDPPTPSSCSFIRRWSLRSTPNTTHICSLNQIKAFMFRRCGRQIPSGVRTDRPSQSKYVHTISPPVRTAGLLKTSTANRRSRRPNATTAALR